MKIKVKADDFIVREVSTLPVSPRTQAHVVFRLSKQDWDTFDLIDLLARRLQVPKQDLAVGGLKDRHGRSEQLITIRYRRDLAKAVAALADQKNFSLTFLGYCPLPVKAEDIRGNHFTITIRNMAAPDLERCLANAEIVSRWGVPNYYDEQRFGSARHGKGFMGKEIFRGSREKALRLYFEPSKLDHRRTRALKSCVLENWGRWDRCLEMAFGEYGSILTYLSKHRRAFHSALSLIDHRFLVFLLNAYQSFLFNRILSGYLTALSGEQAVGFDQHPYQLGSFLFYRQLPDPLFEHLKREKLPVPAWDSRIEDPRIAGITVEVLEREGIVLHDLKIRQMSRVYIHGAERPAILLPEDFTVVDACEDDLYPGKKKMTLRFFLPRGGYATLVVKRLEAGGQAQNLQPGAASGIAVPEGFLGDIF